MIKEIDLTKGSISKTLTRLALPTMGTSLINMLYNLTDMLWLGRLSTFAVAGVGAVGFFTWFGMGLVMISQVGVSVSVSQAYGRKDMEEVKKYISNGIRLDLIIGLIFSFILVFFRHELISFYKLQDQEAIDMALKYIVIVGSGFIFHFINPVLSGIFNVTGNSMVPFIINSVGLIVNIILDPVLIFGLFGFPKLGIRGAAIATVTAQFIVTLIFIFAAFRNDHLFSSLGLLKPMEAKYLKRISKIGFPAFIQTAVHSSISMIIARILADWGAVAIAVQSIGAQIESISWMTAEGFSVAIAAFVGQNYGAGNYDRVKEGYVKGLKIVSSIGFFAFLLFFFGSEPIFRKFTPEDPVAIAEGAKYLKVLAFSQVFMCMEIASIGAFNGIGKTLPPSIVGGVFNGLRIPGALILSATSLGLAGIWWSLTISSVFKGIITTSMCFYVLNNHLKS